jgi:hypothetical protein
MLAAQTAHHHRRCSAWTHASLSRPTSAVMGGHRCSDWRGLCFVLSDKLLGGELGYDSLITILGAIEAVIGLLIELSFIATFTQRFLGK